MGLSRCFAILGPCLLHCFLTTAAFSAEDWGGTGTFSDPAWYEYRSQAGNGYWIRRGQSEASLVGIWLFQSTDEGGSVADNNYVNTWGFGQYRKSTVSTQNGFTVIDFDSANSVKVVLAVPGQNDLSEWRHEAIVSNRRLSQNGTVGHVDATYARESLAGAIGVTPAIANTHMFEFDYDAGDDAWSAVLDGEDIDYCCQGDFTENLDIDLTFCDFGNWTSCLANIQQITSAMDLVDLVIQYPNPYLDFEHVPLEQEYIEACWPTV